jgi:fumagillin biosynthesis cytochrome P450 monooxygenase
MFWLTQSQFVLGGLFVLVLAATQTFLHVRKRSKLPPGPVGLPILGNIGSLPPAGQPEFRHWLSFKEKYGPIASITVLGENIVIVNDVDIATELLEKRATKYSGRPQMFFATVTCKMKEWPG